MLHRRTIASLLSMLVFAAAARADVIYFTNESTGQIQQIAPNGNVSVLVGGFVSPAGLAYNPATQSLFAAVFVPPVSPEAYAIDQISLSGTVTTFTNFVSPAGVPGLAFNSQGDLFASVSTGTVGEIPPSGGAATPYASGLGELLGLAFDSHGNLFAATDTGNFIDEIPAGGGSASNFFHTSGDPNGLAIDSSNNVYLASRANIYKVTPSGSGSVYATASSGNFTRLAVGSNGQLFAVNGDTVDDIVGGNVSPYATISGFVGEMVDVVPEPSMGVVLVLIGVWSVGMRRAHGR
jgi:sugar lactone lactonase YvrE